MRATHTPGRHIRVPDAIWHAAQARAEQDGTTVSAVVVAALIAYGTPEPVQVGRTTYPAKTYGTAARELTS